MVYSYYKYSYNLHETPRLSGKVTFDKGLLQKFNISNKSVMGNRM